MAAEQDVILVHIEAAADPGNLAVSRSQGRVFERGARVSEPRCDPAIFEAAALRDKLGVEAVGMLVSAEEDAVVARRALAMGLDRAFLCADPRARDFDGRIMARVVSRAVAKLGASAVVFGAAESDGIEAETAYRVAEALGWPVISALRGLGALSAPCVARIRPGAHTPRLPSAIEIVRAAKKTLTPLTCAELGLSDDELADKFRLRSVSLAEP
jgi:electron transfer flavoprotein alpha/beta subunit